MKTFIYHDQKFRLLTEQWPERMICKSSLTSTWRCSHGSCDCDKAIASAISSSVLVREEDQEKIKWKVWDKQVNTTGLAEDDYDQWTPKIDHPYDLEVGVEIESKYSCSLDEMQCSETCHRNIELKSKCCFCTVTELAVLTPVEVESESQEELWAEVGLSIDYAYSLDIKTLKEEFHITRIKK